MSTAPEADVLAQQAGMQRLSSHYLEQEQVQKGLSGWPPPDKMARIVMEVFGESR